MEAVRTWSERAGGSSSATTGPLAVSTGIGVGGARGEAAGRPLTVLSVMDYGGLGYAGPVGLAHWWPEVAVEHGRKLSADGADRARANVPDVDVTPERGSARRPPS